MNTPTEQVAIPEPSTLVCPGQISAAAGVVERFAAGCDDVPTLNETRARWSAITAYVREKGREGTARAEAAARVLDQRLGELVKAMRDAGELASHGGDRSKFEGSNLKFPDLGLDYHDVAEAVAMVEHADIVAEIIETSTDKSPPTRNKIRTAIRKEKRAQAIKQEVEALPAVFEAVGIRLPTDPAIIEAMERATSLGGQLSGALRNVNALAGDVDEIAALKDMQRKFMLDPLRAAIELLIRIEQATKEAQQ